MEAIINCDRQRAGSLLNVIVPEDWPVDVPAREGLVIHLDNLRRDEQETLWRIRLIVERVRRQVVGSYSFKGPPTPDGTVEIGWGVLPAYRGNGVATEATNAAVDWAFGHTEVRRIIATIPNDNLASQAVARRLGFQCVNQTHRGVPRVGASAKTSL